MLRIVAGCLDQPIERARTCQMRGQGYRIRFFLISLVHLSRIG